MKSIKHKVLSAFLAASLFIASFASSSCRLAPTPTAVPVYEIHTYEFLGTFDTVISLVGHMSSKEEFDAFTAYAQNRFHELNQLFDIYNDYAGISNLKTINDQAGIAPVAVGSEIMELLSLSKEWYAKTGGAVNVAFGSVLDIWHTYRGNALASGEENAAVPGLQELKKANKHASMDSLVLDLSNSTVFITDPEMRLDVGAVAKGFATQVVADELSELGYTSFAISAGGNVKVVGAPRATGRDTWIIGVQSPESEETVVSGQELIAKVAVNDTSVVTSGWYQRYFTSGGVVYHHIIDPKTLFPSNYFKAVTIVYPDSGIADILSTAAMLMPYDEASAFIEQIPGASAYFVLLDGEIRTAGGMDALLTTEANESSTSSAVISPSSIS